MDKAIAVNERRSLAAMTYKRRQAYRGAATEEESGYSKGLIEQFV